LFGDGAGAMVYSQADGEDTEGGVGILGYSMHSNGKGHGDLICQ
jgi:3-oxoacyl-[acyl-carrier-protein] synthase III